MRHLCIIGLVILLAWQPLAGHAAMSAVIIVLIPLLYIGPCSVVSHQRERGFDQVKEGDTEQHVIQAMGEPVDRETPAHRLTKYGAPECSAPCVQHLWYPNKLSLAGEAWPVDLDAHGHVVHTIHLVSP